MTSPYPTNYAERRRYGERVSTGFVESAINTVVGKRFGKRQQMRWSRPGAHLMLQARTRALDGTAQKEVRAVVPRTSRPATRQAKTSNSLPDCPRVFGTPARLGAHA